MSLYDVLGQNRIAELLSNSIKKQRVSHAYIFTGIKGVGKKKMAIEFAKALNCTVNSSDACGHCSNCIRIEHDNHPDVVRISPEGQSIKIEQIRQLQKEYHYKSMESKVKVYMIEQAEQMTPQAANRLLKFLEEPNSPTVAILITENIHQLLSTIRSRCQIVQFAQLDPNSIVKILEQEGFRKSEIILSTHLTQNLDEVRTLLSTEEFAQMRNLVIQWSEDMTSRKYQVLLSINDKIMQSDYIKEHLPQFLDLLILWYRDILNIRLKRKDLIIYRDYYDQLRMQALHGSEDQIIEHIELILATKRTLSSHVNPQLALEKMVLSL
ncbi:DNA polymerase III subunit delta' [Tepidibacillus infernus]|uniref:DNA polymerase III subunit delta' n=1 Tax=Tepidibacillus decaturensis TaxID=1413211 RepID=A0A135L768_9BACI|nr:MULTISPECIES: DNA polymerase III subunit delta' [Tepidibacillus]KXG44820.1 hypothetical protein U473_12930 [Tepidibacillus decaturensis]GBF11422.1 DNA polymerase III subunit tau [Tepidibacillus sp. HK-1]